MLKPIGSLIFGPTLLGLTGERRKAYIRQTIISGILLVVIVSTAALLMASQSSRSVIEQASLQKKIVIGVAVVLLLQFMYALLEGETIWQLRIKEFRAGNQFSQDNKQQLLDYAAKVQQRGKQHD